MSGPFGSSQWMYSSGGFYPYEIEQSLRLNDDDSAYLSRTPASAGDRKTWTWSGWVKRGNLGSAQTLLGANTTFVEFTSADKIQFDHNGTTVATSAVFRDPSAWYHVVVAVDTTQATAADRTEIYVNGTIQAVTGSYVSQNTDTDVNDATQHNIGANLTPAEYLDGYMAEIKFIDGTALDPTSFGETKSGIWVPKAYSGSYGTNGFYLNFSDSSAIGDDLSGNGNDWTPSGLASTDVMLDSPTNNYCTLNPLLGTVLTFSNGNLNVVSNNTNEATTTGTLGFPQSGKYYYEAKIGGVSGGSPSVGIVSLSTNTTGYLHPKQACIRPVTGNASRPEWVIDGVDRQYDQISSTPLAANDIIQVIYDADNGKVWFGINDTYYGVNSGASTTVSASDIASGVNPAYVVDADYIYTPCVIPYSSTEVVEVNFGQSPFTYTPPSGFLPLNTANLPAPAIDPAEDDVPADYFNTVLYTGTGAAQSITGVGFQPDWTWIKGRSGATDHALYDAVRGVQEQLESNQTGVETTEATGLTAFGADGFSVGALAQLNTSTATYVAWNWLAGNGTSSNTDGTITSTVSVNQKAGFSIATVAAQNNTSTLTVGHGLGAAPKLLIGKSRSGVGGWSVWHPALATNELLYLQSTAAKSVDGGTPPAAFSATSSTTFTVQNWNRMISSGATGVFYAFAEVEGFSKFGSYTGNGSTDGPFVYCGFRPAFIMVKRTNTTGNWTILDNSREGYNVDNDPLYPNLSNAEGATDLSDMLSNGFKLRSTNADVNASGSTYIFAAFAEAPFKYANAR